MTVTPALIFDGDCGFCTTSARWLERRSQGRLRVVAWQHADLDALGLTVEQCVTAVQYVDESIQASGAAAIARALQRCTPPWDRIGMVIGSRAVRPWAQRVYVVVAANRHRLPGGTPACALHGDERSHAGAGRDRPGDAVAPTLR